MNYKHPDLHLHSSYSDGSDTPAEMIEKIRQTDIDIFALTDHDTYEGCLAMEKCLKPGDPTFVGGIEFSCADKYGKYHVLGYCYDLNKQIIRDAAATTHNARREKCLNRIRYLKEVHNIELTEEEIKGLLKHENPGKPHFGELLVAKGIVETKEEGILLLNGYHGKERRLTPEEAIDAILQADGIPVLAHGILGAGSDNLSEEEITTRVKRLRGVGLMGLECYYSSYTKEQNEIMLSLASQVNLMVTAGSDYHGTKKKVLLGDSGNPDPDKMERFYKAVEKLLDL